MLFIVKLLLLSWQLAARMGCPGAKGLPVGKIPVSGPVGGTGNWFNWSSADR